MTSAMPQPAPPFADLPSLDLPILDLPRFQRLMQIAGPEMGPELLARLEEDLTGVAEGLHRVFQAGVPPDWAELRAQTHVLIALAGTVGALRLHYMAETVNRQAHDRMTEGLAEAGVVLATLLAGLVQHVRACRTGGVPGVAW